MIVIHFLRSVLHLIFMVITVIPWALAVLLAAPFLKPDAVYWMCARWLKLAVDSAGFLLGIRNRVIGLENLPTGRNAPAVLLLKHQSVWETLCMPALMPQPLAYVFKRELLRLPFFGWAMGRMDMIYIDRGSSTRAFAHVLRQGTRLLGRGVWVIMFPEGTRIARGQQGDYKTGGTRLAIQAGAPIIPVAVNSGQCWPARAFIKKPGIVTFSIGPAIASTGREPRELMAQAQAWIEDEMRRLDPSAYTP